MDFNKDLNNLKIKWKLAGYYESNYWYNILDFSIITVFIILLLKIKNGFFSGILLGLSIHQYGRLGHEIGHRSGIFNINCMGETSYNYFLLTLNLFLGFDGILWKKEHRQHHEYTMHTSDCQISSDYPPVFTHHLNVFQKRLKDGTFLDKVLLPYQHNLSFLIVILVGKINKFRVDYKKIKNDKVYLRKFLLIFHYLFILWTSYIIYKVSGLIHVFFHIFMTNIICGILHLQLLFSHITTDHHDNRTKNDIRQQIIHSINYTSKPYGFWHWFHVSLAYQIEHHIDPKIASEHLHKITDDVIKLCKDHSITYKSEDFIDILIKYRKTLKYIARNH